MTWDLDTTDYQGRRVRLTEQNWLNHVRRHPEIEAHHGDIPLVLQDPHVVVKASADETHHYYRLGVGRSIAEGAYFRVIVAYSTNGDGWIKSCFFVRAPEFDGEVLVLRHPGGST